MGLGLATAGAPASGWLVVTTVDGRPVYRVSVDDGERWCLHWNHSVRGFAVADCFVYRDGRQWLARSHQPDYAAGLGHIPGRGTTRSDGRGGYWIEDLHEPVPAAGLRLRVGAPTVDHRLVLDDRTLGLSDRLAGEVVIIRVRDDTRPTVNPAP